MRKDTWLRDFIIAMVVLFAAGLIKIGLEVWAKNSKPTYSPYAIYRMRNETNYTTKSPSKTVTSTPRSTNKKYYSDMPDPDDYDSYEDFMDDWDGMMPDGSDAEDYWEDW